MKRIFDILFSICVLLLFFPIGLLLSFWIVFESKGGIFYKQLRVGQFQKPFYILKFRSMRQNADQSGKLTIGMRDPRITKSGYFIRRFKLDEFPQFINVLKGEMSIVGPRPEVPEYVRLYNKEQLRILDVKPGITDYASLEYFKENEILAQSSDPQKTYIEEIMPAKIQLNQKYIDKPTIREDIKIIWRTFVKIIK